MLVYLQRNGYNYGILVEILDVAEENKLSCIVASKRCVRVTNYQPLEDRVILLSGSGPGVSFIGHRVSYTYIFAARWYKYTDTIQLTRLLYAVKLGLVSAQSLGRSVHFSCLFLACVLISTCPRCDEEANGEQLICNQRSWRGYFGGKQLWCIHN